MKERRLINLNYLNILQIAGEGAKDLLQGQLTCDIDKVSAENPILGAICNVKGRVISSFILINPSEEDSSKYWLIGPAAMMQKTHKALEKYSPFYKVDISVLKDKNLYGARDKVVKELFSDYNLNDNQFIHKNGLVLSYLEKIFKLIITNKSNDAIENFPVTSELSDWHLDNFFNKDVEITEDLTEEFTPHEINYDVTERVDFEKGCYTGQEIVSRMHYRAKSLPRLYLAQGSNALLEANVSVEDNTGKRAGTIVKVLNHLDGSYALISIKVNEVDKSYKTSKGRTNLTIKK
jgi:folate-binding protein YgfZ